MNKTVREASKIGPCAEHSRHPSIEAIDAAENHSGLVEMPASRSNGRKLLLTSDGGQRATSNHPSIAENDIASLRMKLRPKGRAPWSCGVITTRVTITQA